MSKKWIVIAGISGFLGVALGAFGAHGLKSMLTSEMMETYKTGILYHLIHSVVLLALALSAGETFQVSKWFFLSGIVLFSFSLYLYAVTGMVFFAMVTPFGGVCFLIGWLWLIVTVVRRKS